jgi:hypothetical protein
VTQSTCRRDNGYTNFSTSKDPNHYCAGTCGKQRLH